MPNDRATVPEPSPGTASRLARAFETYLDWLVHHPWPILIAAAIATLILGIGIFRLRIYVDIEANLPANHPYVTTDHRIQDLFGGKNHSGIAFQPRAGTVWSAQHLALIVELTREMEALEGVIREDVFSLAASRAKDIRGTEEGLEANPILPTSPDSAEGIRRIRDAFERNRQTLGPLVSDDGRMASISADFEESVDEAAVYERIRGLVERNRVEHPDVEFFYTGRPLFTHLFTENARRTGWYFALALGVILVTLFVFFRSVQGMLIPALTGLASTTWSLGVMGLAGAHVDGWNSMTPILILAVAAGHSVQILKRYYEEYERLTAVADLHERSRLAVAESTRRIGIVMVVAGTVAGGGFLSLLIFRIPTIQTFGLFTALGIFSAIVLELTFVPALRTVLPPPRPEGTRARTRASERWLRALGATLARPVTRWSLYAAVLVLLLVSGWLSTRIEVNSSIRDYLAPDSDVRTGAEAMERGLGGVMPAFVLVEGDAGTLRRPDVLSWMDGLATRLEALPSVTHVVSFADVVRRLHLTLHAEDPARDHVPDDAALVAQYLLLYEMTASPEDFARLSTTDFSSGLMRILVRSDRSADVAPATRTVEAWAHEHPLPQGVSWGIGGGGPVSLAVNDTLTGGKLWNIALVLFMVYVLSSLVLGSPLAGIFVILPLILAVALNFAALGAFGIWLNMATATVAAMAVGIGADYAIYVTYRIREEYDRTHDPEEAVVRALATSGKAVVFVATSISVGYLSLAVSDFYVNDILSRLVPLTMAVSCLVALTLLPATLLHARPPFLFGHAGRRRGTHASARVDQPATEGSLPATGVPGR